jgi:cell division protein FtsX
MGTRDSFGIASLLHTAGHLLLVSLAVVSVLCVAFTVYSALVSARGRSESW